MTTKKQIVIGISILVCACVALGISRGSWRDTVSLKSARFWFERQMLRTYPSAERAYSYADTYFDSATVSQYDLSKAFYFLNKTLEYGGHPRVHYQRARILFLKSQFAGALREINLQILMYPDELPSAYYMRGLIQGFREHYTEAAQDYEMYLKHDPHNWAAVNDYAWVLLRAKDAQKAAQLVTDVLPYFPQNVWLLNTSAVALFEMGEPVSALDQITLADEMASRLTEDDWLRAYPGNDPAAAGKGIDHVRASIERNMHMISLATNAAGYNDGDR